MSLEGVRIEKPSAADPLPAAPQVLRVHRTAARIFLFLTFLFSAISIALAAVVTVQSKF